MIKQLPFGVEGFASTVWDSSIVLSKYVQKHPHLFKGKRCLELGAGCGLIGAFFVFKDPSSSFMPSIVGYVVRILACQKSGRNTYFTEACLPKGLMIARNCTSLLVHVNSDKSSVLFPG